MDNIISRLFTGKPSAKQMQAMADELKGMLPGMLQNVNLQGPLGITANYQGLTNTTQLVQQGYCGNADVYAIIKLIAKTAAMIPLYVYEVKDQQQMRKYQQAMLSKSFTPEEIFNIEKIRTKALEIVGEEDPLQQLLDNPDDRNNRQDVYEGFYGFRLISGNSFIYTPEIPDGSDKGKVMGMYIMPSQFVDIIYTMMFPKQIAAYQMTVDGVKVLKTDEVMHLRYFNPDFSLTGAELYGLSPLRAAYKTLQRSASAKDNSVAQFQNGGPAGMMGNKNIDPNDLSKEQIGQIKARWDAEYAGNRNAGKVSFTGGEPVYVRTGLSPVDLNILESEKFTMAQLCNVYGVSDVLFNNHASSTESNVAEMVKRLYTNAALPEVFALRDAINRKVTPKYIKNGRKKFVDCDITGISELQDDMKALATWLDIAWWVTPNEKREMMKQGKYPDKSFDEPWVKTGSAPLSEALMPDGSEIDEENNPYAVPDSDEENSGK